MTAGDRRKAYSFGRFSESLSCWRLRLTGYRVVHQGYRATTGEIDIIARRGQILTFVEVKARRTFFDALHALGPQQRRRIERTALAFLGANPELSNLDIRFDLMVHTPWRWPKHIKGAWITGE